MRRVLLLIQYHGAGFYGWQRQGPDRSVQGVMEEAIADLVGHEVTVQAAGRTDRGVHAQAMPAHVDIESRLGPRDIAMATNARLPQDVAVQGVQEVDPRFHARFDALSKEYRYSFLRSKTRSPLMQDRTHLVPRELDLAAMRVGAEYLVGTHDYASFRSNPDQDELNEEEGTSADTMGPAAIAHGDYTPPPWRKSRPIGSVRTITSCRLYENGPLLELGVAGNGFLRGMVRAIAGSLLDVGSGKQNAAWVEELLNAKDRKLAGPNLPPHGLTLQRVDYPQEAFEGRPAWVGGSG